MFTSLEGPMGTDVRVEKANEFYERKGFEYVTPAVLTQALRAYKGLPDLAVLTDLAGRLVDGLREACC
jgi:hypothetical protein